MRKNARVIVIHALRACGYYAKSKIKQTIPAKIAATSRLLAKNLLRNLAPAERL